MSGLKVSSETQHAQALASDPTRSVFVAANAGSGKTHVLTMRVVRLLLSGVQPGRILCLTYTKAAAAEMQNRVFATLARWTRMDDAQLAAELRTLDNRADDAALARARRLFATALETPGGLKIQTIHAFCEAILHQFPLEANVPGHFEVLDEAESALLLAEARRLLAVTARLDGGAAEDRALAEAFADALELAGEDGFNQLIGACIARRDKISQFITSSGGLEPAIDDLAAALEVDLADDPLVDIADAPGFDAAFCARLAAAAANSTAKTDQSLSEKLAALRAAQNNDARHACLRALALTKDGAPYKLRSVATKAVVEAFPDLEDRLAMLADFLAEKSEILATRRLFIASRAALTIADRLDRDYRMLKAQRGKLDFEDLIVGTAELLLRSEASAWVHYKLDRGIDHVLVDEAQDTSYRQWQVVRALVDEFFHDADSGRRARTIFAVGDEKQSIYSFQGASPAMFAAERRRLERLAVDAGLPFERVGLHQSFRSAAEILAAVDHVFAAEPHRHGLSSENEPPVHVSARADQPGLVEVWPTIRPEPVENSDDWLAPIDHQPQSAPIHRLARRIARQIESWLGTPITHKGVVRPLDAGDVIILVRKRSAFVAAMGAALRGLGNSAIRVAGADRLRLTDHLAVQDLMALGRCIANIEDELSLAEVLKSPLFGFDDQDLMAIALSRKAESPSSLFLALRRIAGENGAALLPRFTGDATALTLKVRAALTRLDELRSRAGFSGVFAFYARLLGPEGGRAALAARLGPDTGEVLDAFLDLALAAEEGGRQGLDAFLADLAANPPTIRREMTAHPGEVRIMTVHAAKGLEAPVVFLVDPGSAPFTASHAEKLIEWTDMPGRPPQAPAAILWCPGSACRNAEVERLATLEKERAEDEYRRLLYVGLTRAADRLVICGVAGQREPAPETWAQQVLASLGPDYREFHAADGSLAGWRYGHLPEGSAPQPASAPAEAAIRRLELSPLPPEQTGPRPLIPSQAGGDTIGEFEAPAFVSPIFTPRTEPGHAIRRGQMAHRLLQVLPEIAPDEQQAAAGRYLRQAAPDWSEADRAQLAETVLGILSRADFAAYFAPGSQPEVTITGTVSVGGRAVPVNGLIDRLAVVGDRVMLIDYKTSRPFPADAGSVPEAHRRQIALYAALVAPLYPGKIVEAALLYTEGPILIQLTAESLALDA